MASSCRQQPSITVARNRNDGGKGGAVSDLPKPSIAWQEAPEEPELPLIPILSPKPGQPVYCIITSARITGVVTHFIGQRTKPCTGDATRCDGCTSGRPKRWKGYLAAVVPPSGRQVLAELTYEAHRGCKELHGIGAEIYGKKLTLTRMGKSANSRVQAELAEVPGKANPGKPFDVHEALIRIWFGVKRFKTKSAQEKFNETVRGLVHQVGELPQD
jgi:hypothetical protein